MHASQKIVHPRIAVLSERVRNQIAAGEVIERPASVVKELVENAIDAGATAVRVDLEEGGAQLVRVSDDGSGMAQEDLRLAFVAHATSKLFEVDDLDHIGSLGFRGEALASMGAIARCSIVTRTRASETGWKIECAGAAISEPREAGAPVGTTVEVRELFYNVPARRRFLKTTATELGRALDVVQRIALAHEGIGFTVTHDGKRVFDVEANMDLLARIRRTFGADLSDALVRVDGRDGDVRLSGYVAPPRFARGDTARQMWFLNSRTVRDKVLVRALKDSYKGFLFDSRQPVAFLSLSMDPAKVDVNVHPAKSDVRFREERRLFGFIVNTLREAVRTCDMATPGARLVERAVEREARALPFSGSIAAHYPPLGASSHVREREPLRVVDVPRPAGTAPPTPVASDEVRGPFLQVARTYIVRPLGDGFEIVDQHALHERIQFESLVAEMRRGRIETQRLLVPELVELSRAEVSALEPHLEQLSGIGIELAAFGATTIAVHGLPARLARPRPKDIVHAVLAAIEGARALEPEQLMEDVLHRAACRSSVMAGDVLSDEEMRSLLVRGKSLVSDQTCVHGRPTRVRFVGADLERAFERR
ncbi:MAG: DNA mismatch repair endonuclease MutL [Planctomycetes bacterium]|nr:DNA mismatch repair endonuclease MutL [Planctomycetota bacterium]